MPETAFRRLFRTAGAAVKDLTRRKAADTGDDGQAVAQTRRYWDDNIALTLSDLARAGETKASGRVQFISLADFRAAIGPLWAEYRDRILLIVETTIGRMIGRGHTFIPVLSDPHRPENVDTWLLLCPDLDEAEAMAHAEIIAERIGEKLVGAHFADHDPPLPRAATLDLTGVVSADGSINLDAVRSAVTRARSAQTAVAAAKVEAIVTPQTTKRLHASAAVRAAWCAATETEDAFFLRPVTATGVELVSPEAVGWPESVAIKLCETAATMVGDIARGGMRAKLALPLPYALLYTPAATGLRQAIDAIPKQIRLMHLRVEIVRIPAHVPSQQLAALREIFRPAVREVAFLVDPFAPCDAAFDLDHVVIGTDMSAARGWDETDLRTTLTQLRDGALHCPTYVLGLRNRDHVRMAISMGIHEVGGQSISSDLERLPAALQLIPRAALTTP